VYEQCVTDTLIHLSDTSTFERLTEKAAWDYARDIESHINDWLTTHRKAKSISKDDAMYIKQHLNQNNQSPFGQFYVSIIQNP